MSDKPTCYYEMFLSGKQLVWSANSYDELIAILEEHAVLFREMQAAGVELDLSGDGFATFTTSDPAIGERFGMEKWVYDEKEDDFVPEETGRMQCGIK